MQDYVIQIIPFSGCRDADMTDVEQFYRLRKSVFIDEMGWDLNSIQDSELDQYDCSWSVYILVKDKNTQEVVAGARMIRTDREEFVSQLDEYPTSYMIRDAYLGRLDDMPKELCYEEPPCDSHVWELTRLAAKGRFGEVAMLAVNDFLAEQGANQCLALGSPLVFRVAKKLGFRPEPIGDIQSSGNSGAFFAFRCWVRDEQQSVQLAAS